MKAWLRKLVAALAACALALPTAGFAQSPAPAAGGDKTFSQEQLDQMLAPVALYPDALLAQVLMASTYPLEVVSAARWVQANPKVTGKALEEAMHKQSWDPSVRSLTEFPTVLQMMNDKIEWTQQLGDAFLGQRDAVMTSVQALRQKAYSQGNLKSTQQQKVVVEKETIIIQPASTTVVYVPVYNPTVVYGTWWYPAYVPYYWYPVGYVYAPGLGFTTGVIVGAALWGGCNWRGHDVTININRYNQFNRTHITNVNWQHNAVHRKGVPYRDPTLAQKYDRNQAVKAANRDVNRNRAGQGARDLSRAGPDRPAVRDGMASDRPAARDVSDRRGPRDRADAGDSGPDRGGPDRGARPGRPGGRD